MNTAIEIYFSEKSVVYPCDNVWQLANASVGSANSIITIILLFGALIPVPAMLLHIHIQNLFVQTTINIINNLSNQHQLLTLCMLQRTIHLTSDATLNID